MVEALRVLLLKLGSVGEASEIVAVLTKVPAAAPGLILTTMLMVALEAALMSPSVKVKLVVPLTVPWDMVAETKLIPGGRLSCMVTDWACCGAAFMVYCFWSVLPLCWTFATGLTLVIVPL